MITHMDTHTLGSSLLDEGSARRRGLCLYGTQHSSQIDIHVRSGIRILQSQQASVRRPKT